MEQPDSGVVVAAAGPTGVESPADAVVPEGVVTPDGGAGPEVVEPEGRMVPVNVLQAMRDEMTQLKEKASQVDLYEQRVRELSQAQYRPVEQPTQATDPFSEMHDDDVLSVGQAKGLLGNIRSELENLKVTASNPNWEDQVREHLVPLLQQNPQLQPLVGGLLQGSRNPQASAIALTKFVQGMKAQGADPATVAIPAVDPAGNLAAEFEKLLGNASKPGVPASGGGTSLATRAQQVTQMTSEQFAAYREEVKRRGGM